MGVFCDILGGDFYRRFIANLPDFHCVVSPQSFLLLNHAWLRSWITQILDSYILTHGLLRVSPVAS